MNKRNVNILLLTSDQQHWYTLGLQNPEIETPNLDRLARRGTLFTRAYCPNPTCTPTRASIITGMMPSAHGAWSLGTKLLEHHKTLGQTLSEGGYATALVGKAHFQPLVGTEEFPSLESYPLLRDLDYWRSFTGPWYGFDRVELARNHADEAHVGQHYALWMEEKGLKDWKRHFQNTWMALDFNDDPGEPTAEQRHTWSIPEEYHYNAWIAERSNEIMEQSVEEGRPFFLWSSFFDPHPPYLVPEPWDTMYDPETLTVPEMVPGEHNKNPEHFRKTQEEHPDFSNWKETGGNAMHGCGSHLHSKQALAKDIAVYYGMISCMDKYIGVILDKLEDLNIEDNTLILFTSDHGHYYGHHGLDAKGPFHYEDGIRVPYIVSWPGRVPEDERSDALQSLVDLAPSFLGAAGMDAPFSMTGVDQHEVWCGAREMARDHVVVENRHQPTTIHMKTFVDKRYKLTVYFNQDYGELFDLQEDPAEVDNLWDSTAHRTLKSELMARLLHADMANESMPMPRIGPA